MDPALQNQLNRIETGVNGNGGKITQLSNQVKDFSTNVSNRFDKLARWLRLPQLLNALTLLVTLHNAAMLSRNLIETLGEIIDLGLQIIGLRDENGKAFDISEILGKQANSLFESLLGKEVWNGTKATWNRANRILSAAANITYSVRSMFASIREIAEWTGENTGKIGNALKKSGVVFENSYPYMPENLKAGRGVLDKIESLDDAASSLASVTGEVRSVQEEANEILENSQKFKKLLEEGEPKPATENKPVATAATTSKTVSQAPAATDADLVKSGG